MTDPAVLAALASALERDPHNGSLWVHYADMLVAAERPQDALNALRHAVEVAATRAIAVRKLVPLLREQGLLAEALIRAEAELKQGHDAGLVEEIARIQALRNAAVDAPAAAAEIAPAPLDDDEWAAQFDWGDLRVTFADVAGLEDVKRQIHLRIIAPFKQPEVYQAFGRKGGGGILLYGPPGCGKTYIARATAGELGARFVSVSIHEMMDKYWGESEKLIHALFEHARRTAPTVLFFDEFDAFGAPRGRDQSQFWKSVIDQLLQEMDGVKARNRDVLLLAATNVPWNVDSAFRRPGRFDRVLFVTPPDKAARLQLLEQRLRELPGGAGLDVKSAVEKTELYSGADLIELAERAAERALERSLESSQVQSVEPTDLARALAQSRASTLEWIATARNYARYSNEGGQYDELVEYLKRVRKW